MRSPSETPARVPASPRGLLILVLAVAGMLAAGRATPRAQEPLPGQSYLSEAERLFEELDYERAVPALDQAIAALQSVADDGGEARESFVRALELRARARFGLSDVEGASSDFRLLLESEPGFTFDAQVSPRVVALLENVRKATVGGLRLSVDPSDAAVEIEGRRITPGDGALAVRAGDISITVSRVGYRPVVQRATVRPGATTDLTLALERIAAAVFIVTSPPGVEVKVAGLSHGRTEAGPLSPEYAQVAERLGVPADQVSRPLVLTDIAAGTHDVTFSRDCYVTQQRRFSIDQLADYRIEPVHLEPAIGTLTIESTPPGAQVFVDGVARGVAPLTLSDVCAGARTVDLRSPQGRATREVTVAPNESASVSEALKPTFALLPTADAPSPGLPDNRTRVERVLSNSRRVGLYVPTEAELEAAMDGQPLPSDWLAFDASGQPIGAASSYSPAARRELSARLAKALDVQGVAAVSQPVAASSELVVSLLAAGAGHPDVVPVIAERVDSVNDALERFDYVPQLFSREIGAAAIEVLDVAGLTIASVEPNGPAARAGLAVGDVIVKAGDQAVTTAADLERALQSGRPDGQLALEVKDRKGAPRQVSVGLTTSPRLVSVADRTLLFNSLAVALRSRLAAAAPEEQPFVRLNLAVALLRLGDLAGARTELQAVQLPAGPGISQGTQHYLMGLVHEGLGDLAAAEQAFRAAEAAGGLLTEEGPPIAQLAKQKLTR